MLLEFGQSFEWNLISKKFDSPGLSRWKKALTDGTRNRFASLGIDTLREICSNARIEKTGRIELGKTVRGSKVAARCCVRIGSDFDRNIIPSHGGVA